MNNEELESSDDSPRYGAPETIDKSGIYTSLSTLHLINDDMYLRSQAFNLNIVDNFLTDLEYRVLHDLHEMGRTPPSTHFLSAQSQMWIFAAYELLRTWQQRAKEMEKWADNGGFQNKLAGLRAKNDEYMHSGREIRIRQIESFLKDPSLAAQVKNQRLHLHVPFTRLEYLRVSIAKHEISGKDKSAASNPGYARINSWCGSLDYELENGHYSMGYLSRRDVAESIRLLDFSQAPPTDDEIKSFDDYMRGNDPFDS